MVDENDRFPLYRGNVNTAREPELDPGQGKTALVLERETGPREKIRAIIANAQGEAVTDLFDGLIRLYGGFTAHTVIGGWRAEDGTVMVETGLCVEVSGTPGGMGDALDLFAKCGKATGERWVHLEQTWFNARHVKVNE